MATYSKYKLYELYETDDGINWFPMGEYKAVLSEMYSRDCGYSARTIVEYDDECSGTTKIITATTKYQETYDSGSTWVTTSSTSSVTYEENSEDCGYSARTITETVDDCSGTTKVITNITKYQETYDGGNTWITTSSTSSVTYEENSQDCGYSARTIVEYDDECSGTTKIITATTKYQETFNGGITWITTATSSSVTYEENSEDCGYSARTITETIDNCRGTTKVITTITKNQETYDSGTTWITTATSSSETYEYDSQDCAYTPKDYQEEYLTFVAKTSGTIAYSGYEISYSTDYGATWSRISTKHTVDVIKGEILFWKGNAASFGEGIGRFSGGTASFDVQGNIMSLLYGDNFVNQKDLSEYNGAFRYLFKDSKVVNAKNLILPATTLSFSCYNEMFNGCTSLITAPVLSATTLDSHCYAYMFMNCSSLTTAPQLPATTMVTSCYHCMFQGCTSLTTAPELNATTLANWCYGYMFRYCTNLNYIKMLATNIASDSFSLYYWVEGVANSGTFVKNANMTNLPSGNSGIPNNWTVQNA